MSSRLKMLCFGLVFVCFTTGSAVGPLPAKNLPPPHDSGAIVRLWNQIATDAVVVTGGNAPASSGVLLAIVQLAAYDAVVAIEGRYAPYATSIPRVKGASIEAAVAQSAHDVLVSLLPSQASALDAALATSLAAVPEGMPKAKGIWVGRRAAAGNLANRDGDGRFSPEPYLFQTPGPGVYQPTPPAFSTSPLVPWVARVRPFTMLNPSQFRPAAPPPLDSRRWAKAYNLTRLLGDVNSELRTPWQSEVAIFWTEHTPRQWNRNIRTLAGSEALDALSTARLLAVTNTAMADAWIGCWDGKYHYNFWRPVTAIQQGNTDGRDDTVGDPAWLPFRTTPNHPEYPGAHGCVSTAASHALRRFFGRDETTFVMDADISGAILQHTFSRFTDAGREARAARIYGGMHYEFSNEAGARLGRQVVAHMFAKGFFRRTGH
jgi:hypothetical protein